MCDTVGEQGMRLCFSSCLLTFGLPSLDEIRFYLYNCSIFILEANEWMGIIP